MQIYNIFLLYSLLEKEINIYYNNTIKALSKIRFSLWENKGCDIMDTKNKTIVLKFNALRTVYHYYVKIQ